jgi:hypothetical protein
MPVVSYYRGRPACVWTAAMSGPARAAAESSSTATSSASWEPAAPPVQRRTQEGTSAPAATAASASVWEAWASHWFTPHRRP